MKRRFVFLTAILLMGCGLSHQTLPQNTNNPGSIYDHQITFVNGEQVDDVTPWDSFINECEEGLDRSIKITYHTKVGDPIYYLLTYKAETEIYHIQYEFIMKLYR